MTTFNGTSGVDLFSGTATADLFAFAPGELANVDTVSGRGGEDLIRFIQDGAATSLFVGISAFANVSSIETIDVSDALTSADITISNLLVSRSGWVGNAAKVYDMEFTLGTGNAELHLEDVTAAYHLFVDGEDGDDDIHGGRNTGLYLGGGGVDVLFAGLGIETFAGGEDADFVRGGAGDVDGDTYWGGNEGWLSGDVDAESIEVTTGGTFAFTVSGFEYIFLANAANTANITIANRFFETRIEGGSQGDVIRLSLGAQALAAELPLAVNGNGSDDFIYGAGAGETLNGGAGNDHLEGGDGKDRLNGGSGVDYLHGGDGADTLNGGADADIMIGGSGDDTFLDVGKGDLVSEGAGGGRDRIETALRSLTLGGGVEELRYTGTRGATLTGSIDDNIMWGGGKADTILGADGADTLYGNEGGDTLRGNDGNDDLHGEADNDFLYGQKGNDDLYGGGGSDLLDGGADYDTARYTGSKTHIEADFTDGNEVYHGSDVDTLVSIERIYGSDVDDLVKAAGFGAVEFHGGEGYDTLDVSTGTGSHIVYGDQYSIEEIYMGSGDDILRHFIYMDGGGGNDLFYDDDSLPLQYYYGGEGSDTVSFAESGSVVPSANLEISLADPGQNKGWAQLDKFSSIENLTGNDLTTDLFYGNEAANTLDGRHGDDSLFGDDGDDTLIGGGGFDQLYGEDGNDVVKPGSGSCIAEGGEGIDTISYDDGTIGSGVIVMATTDGTVPGYIGSGGAADHVLNGFENIVGSSHGDTLTGDGLANDIWGGNGADVIEGGGGGDRLDGEGSLDTLSYATSGKAVTVNLLTGAVSGGDAQGDSIANFENIRGSAKADTLTGSDGGNEIEGGNGADIMDGGLGENTLSYEHSAAHVVIDLLAGTASQHDAGGDVFVNFQNLRGSAFDDRLAGDDGKNDIWGGGGADVIFGGKGGDQFHGEGGGDVFRYTHTNQSRNGGANSDHVWDFSRTDGDVIDLSGIDAIAGGGDDAFTLTAGGGAGAATGANGEVWWISTGNGGFTVYANADGVAGADVKITLVAADAGGALGAADFIL